MPLDLISPARGAGQARRAYRGGGGHRSSGPAWGAREDQEVVKSVLEGILIKDQVRKVEALR